MIAFASEFILPYLKILFELPSQSFLN